MKVWVLFLGAICLSFSIFPFQQDKFSGDVVKYPDELYEFMSNVSDKHTPIVDAFIKGWEEDSIFTSSEMEEIVEMSLLMVKRKARPYPHFVEFLHCMMLFKEFPPTPENKENWTNIFLSMLDKRKTKTSEILSVLKFTRGLLSDNAIYTSASTTWRADSKDYLITDENIISVQYEQTHLICVTRRNDSLNIYNTSGVVNVLDKSWKGTMGMVTWERAGISTDIVKAELSDYSLNLTKSEYDAENVVFTNTRYFDEPIEGKLTDKVKSIAAPKSATYPKFFSYTTTFFIEDLYKDVDYSGGISMQGAKAVGQGTVDKPAKMELYREDTLVITARSPYFSFREDRVLSERTGIVIHLRHDSIYHADLFMDFRLENRELTLSKSSHFSSEAPYFNSYHKIDMKFDQLTWRLGEDYMRFSAQRGATIGNAWFQSANYFNYDVFINMQMMDIKHPLINVRNFDRFKKGQGFTIREYADYLNLSLTQTKHLIMRLANQGFVFYNEHTEYVKLKERTHNYLAASINRIDYDVIDIPSRVEAPAENAIFDIRTYDLTINGIPSIQVSDSQNVLIYPKNDQIVMKSNRDFQFDGTVVAGLMTFYGKNFFFNYDSFKVSLQNVDSVNIEFMTGKRDNFGLPDIGQVSNKLNQVTGEVLIDKPDNKSGRESYPEFPIFRSKEASYVNYASGNAQGGVYEQNDFYFKVDPFEMDSLDNFNASALAYTGEFVSAGIFPEFKKELSIQPDRSLGFKHQTPKEGMPMYEGKGVFYNEIWLSNRGLKGNGTLDYLTSTTWSDDFNFYPDSMNTNSQKYIVKHTTTETEYPRTNSVENRVHWEPYVDKMWIDKTSTLFTMFNDSTTLNGNLLMQPSGLSGNGRMDLKNSELVSNTFEYKADEIMADTSDFYLKSLQKEGFTVLTENVNSHIDYRKKKGWFRSNEEYSLVTFPENKYISYIDVFIWDMTKKQLAMGTQTKPELPDYTFEDTEPEGPRFISTDRKQDSLSFVSPLAFYDYQHNFINATGVKFIDVADARIYPFEGKLTVKPDYFIDQLNDAWLKANRWSQYHKIHTANLNITSRRSYSGLGNYDYVDENDDIQTIHFKEIKVDTSEQTIAEGEIYESHNFTLSPVYQYQGKVFLTAGDSLLRYKGATLIEHNCDVIQPEWLYFDTKIYPDDIYIPISLEPLNIDRSNIYNGLYVYYDSVHIYPTFLNKRKNYSDRPIVNAAGYLYYSKAQQRYKIGSKEKINNFLLPEDYLSLSREECELYGEGNIDLGENLGQVKLTTYGTATRDLEEHTTTLNVMMGIDFFMHEEMKNVFGHEVDSFPGLQPVNMNNTVIKKTMHAWVGEEITTKITDELNLFGTIKNLPSALKHTILINELKLVWNDQTNSYQSEGMIGIASINGIQINKRVTGFFELRIKRSGDIMDLYLELDKQNFYYFGYTRGVMQTLSHNRTYVNTIMNMKTKDRKVKTSRGETPYNYLISTERKKRGFYSRWQNLIAEPEEEEDDPIEVVDPTQITDPLDEQF